MIDVGGSNVKLMASGHSEVRKFKSGPDLSPQRMVSRTLKFVRDWDFEAITIGFPGLIIDGQPGREPLNLAPGWLGFDFEGALGRPVRLINDAALQALAGYEGGRLLFLGLGTGIGSTLIIDDVIFPVELGVMLLSKNSTVAAQVSGAGLAKFGLMKWRGAVGRAVKILQDAFWPTDTIIGGGNAKLLVPIPDGCRCRANEDAFVGAARLWGGSGMVADPRHTSWHIRRLVVKNMLA